MIHVAAAIIKNEQDQILICQRSPDGDLPLMWEFPGGKVEAGESPEHCAVRELMEELNIEIDITQFFGETIYSYPTKDIRLSFYLANIIRGQIKAQVHQQIAWVNKDQLDQYDFAPADVDVVEKLKNS